MKHTWLQKIEALRTNDACEIYLHARWTAAHVVLNGGAGYWKATIDDDRDRRPVAIHIEHVRLPGQTAAWPGRIDQPGPAAGTPGIFDDVDE